MKLKELGTKYKYSILTDGWVFRRIIFLIYFLRLKMSLFNCWNEHKIYSLLTGLEFPIGDSIFPLTFLFPVKFWILGFKERKESDDNGLMQDSRKINIEMQN